jgi:hypothetical protein
MVDTSDLKSDDLISREGSSPSVPNIIINLIFIFELKPLISIKRF